MYDLRTKSVPVFEGRQKSGFLTVLRSVSVVSAPITLMTSILLSVRYQQLRIQMLSITQLCIYYGIATYYHHITTILGTKLRFVPNMVM